MNEDLINEGETVKLESCVDKNNKRIYVYDLENEYGIRDVREERKLRYMSGTGELMCPECKETVILKAGQIKSPHFAHKQKSEKCFLSSYTYNHMRDMAMKKIYQILKNDTKLSDFSFNKAISENCTADIYVKLNEDYKSIINREYAIILRNTSVKYSEWFDKHNEILENGIIPIYFNYGTTAEIQNILDGVPRKFFYRNLFNLIGNNGLKFISINTDEVISLIPEYHLDHNNELKKHTTKKEVLVLDKDTDFLNLIDGFSKKVFFRFDSPIEPEANYRNIMEAKENKIPLLVIKYNRDISLAFNIDYCSTYGEDEFETIELEGINYYKYFIKNYLGIYYDTSYYYPNQNIFTDDCYSDFADEDQSIESFLEDWQNTDVRVIPLTKSGIFNFYIEEIFSKNLHYKLDDYDFIGDKALQLYKGIIEKKAEEITTDKIKEMKDLADITFPKKYLEILMEGHKKLKDFPTEHLSEIQNLNKVKKEYIRCLLAPEDNQKYKIIQILLRYHEENNPEINIKDLNQLNLYKLFLSSLSDITLNTFTKITEINLKLLLAEYKLKPNSLEEAYNLYLKDKNFQKIKNYFGTLDKGIVFDFLKIKLLQIISNEDFDLFKLASDYGIDDSTEIRRHNGIELEQYLYNRYSSHKSKIDIFNEVLKIQNIGLVENYLNFYRNKKELEHNYLTSISMIIDRTYENKKTEVSNFLKNRDFLNLKSKNNSTLFYLICTNSKNVELINLCLKMGADLNFKNNKGKSPKDILSEKNIIFS